LCVRVCEMMRDDSLPLTVRPTWAPPARAGARWMNGSGGSGIGVWIRGAPPGNTKWAYGLVVFTGMDTKLMQNATEKPLKRSTIERATQRYNVGILAVPPAAFHGLVGGGGGCEQLGLDTTLPRQWVSV